MTNDLKTTIQGDLEERIVTMADTIVAISLQGYVVNSSKFCKLNHSIIINLFLKDYISFDENRKKEIIKLYNSL